MRRDSSVTSVTSIQFVASITSRLKLSTLLHPHWLTLHITVADGRTKLFLIFCTKRSAPCVDLTFDSQVSKHGEQRKDINATVSSCVIMTFHQCTMEKNICVVVVKESIFSGVERGVLWSENNYAPNWHQTHLPCPLCGPYSESLSSKLPTDPLNLRRGWRGEDERQSVTNNYIP